MKFKSFLFNLLFPTLAIFTFSCGSKTEKISNKTSKPYYAQEDRQILRINISAEPKTLDPRKARALADLNLIKVLNDGLTRLDEEGNPQLALAENIESSNEGTTYKITLKKAHWSNGDLITSKDFVYAWKSSLSPSFPSDYAYELFVIKNAKAVKEGNLPSNLLGINAVDDQTLIVKLEKPIPYFEKLLTFPIFFPVNSKVDQQNKDWSRDVKAYVCTGPFILQTWKHHDEIIVKKNKKYWDKRYVKLEKIHMVMVSEETALQMFENDELDWEGSPFSNVPIDAIQNLKAKDSLSFKPASGTYWIRSNVESPLLQNQKIRKALALSINRQEIVEHVTQGNQLPATGIVPASLSTQSEPYFTDADYEKAKKYFAEGLKEAKLKPEAFSKLKLTYAASEKNHRIAQVIQQQWLENLGILISLEALETQVYFDKVSKKNYQLSCGDWCADFGDPINFLQIFETKKVGNNNTNWESPDYAKAITDSFYITDKQKRLEKLCEAEAILMEEVPVIPVFNYTFLYLKKPYVKDLVLTTEGHMDFKKTYIQ